MGDFMHLKRTILTLGTATAAAAMAVALAPAASAHSNRTAEPLHVVKTLSSDYIGPLQFAVKGRKILVADSFAGTLNLLGQPAPLATVPGIGGVAFGPDHTYAYTTANEDHSATFLVVVSKHGVRRVNLARFEKLHNPDKRNHYGTTSTDPCVIAALTPPPGSSGPEGPPPPAKYEGLIDSNPYAVTAGPHGSWIVADAGGNDIIKVDRWGNPSVLAVLPPQPQKITAELAAQLIGPEFPACVLGTTYNFEPVPTDVEFNPWGQLYATTLGSVVPGNGAVYKIDYRHVHKLAGGLTTPTNLAIDSHGNIFVAELFAGRISEIVWCTSTAVPVLELPGVAAVEYSRGHLYASTAPAAASEGEPTDGPPPPGQILLLGSNGGGNTT
jgi:hypothetical protein